jgi:hypothetical protein
MKSKSSRSGYAMLLVLAFLVLFLSVLSLAYSQIASLIRAETARAQEALRDQGSIPALGRAMALLETGYPPTNPYECGTIVDSSMGSTEFTVTFTSQGSGNWSVDVVPTAAGDNPLPMPLLFTSQTPP